MGDTEPITAECGCMTEPDGYGNEVVAQHASGCELFLDDRIEGECDYAGGCDAAPYPNEDSAFCMSHG